MQGIKQEQENGSLTNLSDLSGANLGSEKRWLINSKRSLCLYVWQEKVGFELNGCDVL